MQAILFYAPRWLWKHWEGGKIHALMLDMDVGICTEAEKNQKKKILLNYLWENLRYHNWWAYRYYLCELLAFLNVVGKFAFTALQTNSRQGRPRERCFKVDNEGHSINLKFTTGHSSVNNKSVWEGYHISLCSKYDQN